MPEEELAMFEAQIENIAFREERAAIIEQIVEDSDDEALELH